jgi:hypothetical protein
MQRLSKLLNNFVDLKRIMVEPGKKIALEKDFDPAILIPISAVRRPTE